MKILCANGFSGVVIPDHTPQMTCDTSLAQRDGLCHGVHERADN